MGMKRATFLLLILFSYLHIAAASTLKTTMDSAYTQKNFLDTNKTSTPLIRRGVGGGGHGGGSSRGGKGGRGRGVTCFGGCYGVGGAGGHFHGHGGNNKSWSTKRDPCCSVGGVLLMAAIGALLLE